MKLSREKSLSSRVRNHFLHNAIRSALPALLGISSSSALATVQLFNTNTFGSGGFGQSQFDLINYASLTGHYTMMGTDAHRSELVANNHVLGVYYDTLTDLYNGQVVKSGSNAGDTLNQYAVDNFTSTGARPNWILLNEISSGLWTSSAGYRQWVVDTAARLKDNYGINVITFAPFSNPANNAADWQALAAKSYIGIEAYISGSEMQTNGNSLAWAQSFYQSSKNSYTALGVPTSQMFMTEYFSNNTGTNNDSGWGRAGVDETQWETTIQIRQDAIKNVSFAGFISYAWGSNAMNAPLSDLLRQIEVYRSRFAISTQQPQWLADAGTDVGGVPTPSWGQSLNWLGGVPNSAAAVANFYRTNTTARTVTLDGTRTVGTVTFNSPFAYTIDAGSGGTLVLNNSGIAANVSVALGSHAVTANTQLTNGATFSTSSATALTMSGILSGSGTLTKSGSGTLQLNNSSNSYTGATIVSGGLLQFANAGAYASTASLQVNSGAAAAATSSSLATTFLNKITAAGANSTGSLALASVDGTSNIDFTTSPLNNLKTVGMSIGALGTVTYTGTITPDATQGYRLGGGGTLILPNTNALTGTRNLTVTNGGTVVLAASNNYIGSTTITGGSILNVPSDTALGNSANGITFNGGTLQIGGASFNTLRAITLNSGGGTIDTNSFNSSFSQVIAGTGALTKTGTGNLTLTATNTYSGGTNINGGVLRINVDASLGSGSVAFDGGTLQLGAAFSTSRAVTLNAGGGTIDTNGNTNTFSAVISGAGALTKAGTGTLLLTGVNTYSGGTNINAGTLKVNADSALGNSSGALALNGGTLQFGASFNLAGNRAISLGSSGGTFDTNGFNSTITQTITGSTGALIKAGLGTLTISPTNSYSVPININGGVLATNIPSSATLIGVISGAGNLTKTGAGTLQISQSNNSYTGGITISQGMVQVSNEHSLGGIPASFNPTAVVIDGATLRFFSSAGVMINANRGITVSSAGGTLEVANTSGTSQINSKISGTGKLTKTGVRAVFIASDSSDSFSGGWDINEGRLNAHISGTNILGTGTIALNAQNGDLAQVGSGGTSLNLMGVLNNPIALNPSGSGIDSFEINATNTLTFNGIISGTGGLQKSGGLATPGGSVISPVTSGTMVIGGNNTYSGPTQVIAGILRLIPTGAWETIPNTSAVSVSSGATLDLSGSTETVASISGAGSISLGAGQLTAGGDNSSSTFSGVISGAGGKLIKSGTGTLLLSAANTFTGSATVNAGTLKLAGGAAIADSAPVSIASAAGATLDLNGTTETIGSLAGGGSSGGSINLTSSTLTTGGNNASTTFGGTLAGTGNLTKSGTGAMTIVAPGASAAALRLNQLTVNGGGKLIVAPRASSPGGANHPVYVNALNLGAAGAESGALDLNDNDIVINYSGASPFSTIQQYVFDGYSGGPDTTKVGIVSTTGQNTGGVTIHALIDNNSPEITPGYPDWPQGSGVTTDSDTVIGKYTYFGDVNLDGQVTGDDYGPIDADLDNAITYSEGASWIFGDTNFDQVVTGDDYGYVDSNIGLGTANPLAPAGVAVPEPAAISLLAPIAGILASRRRRSYSSPRIEHL